MLTIHVTLLWIPGEIVKSTQAWHIKFNISYIYFFLLLTFFWISFRTNLSLCFIASTVVMWDTSDALHCAWPWVNFIHFFSSKALELFLFLLSYIWPRSSGFPTKIDAHFLSVRPSCMTSKLLTFLSVKSHNYFLRFPSILLPQAVRFWLVFGRCSIRNWTGTPNTLMEAFHGFP